MNQQPNQCIPRKISINEFKIGKKINKSTKLSFCDGWKLNRMCRLVERQQFGKTNVQYWSNIIIIMIMVITNAVYIVMAESIVINRLKIGLVWSS